MAVSLSLGWWLITFTLRAEVILHHPKLSDITTETTRLRQFCYKLHYMQHWPSYSVGFIVLLARLSCNNKVRTYSVEIDYSPWFSKKYSVMIFIMAYLQIAGLSHKILLHNILPVINTPGRKKHTQRLGYQSDLCTKWKGYLIYSVYC